MDRHDDPREDATLRDPRLASSPRSSGEALSAELGDRYDLGPVLGRGGMGEVRLARDTRIDREVAVKLMRSPQHDEALIARFFREARVQGVLDHPAVVPVHDLGLDANGNPYFVMKRLTGITLGDVLNTTDEAVRDRWPRRQLLARLVDICLATEFAHTRGVIHRDLKPANIMLGDFGEAYVLDWGLARIASDRPSLRDVLPLSGDGFGAGDSDTRAGELLGTPGYMSPEQARGEVVDARTDVYALGCVLFEILVGRPALPRGADAIPATLAALEHRPSMHRGEVPPELDDLCARATAANRDLRPTARALGDGIQAYLDGDRDLERRRELADEHARRARAALGNTGDQARADAMREAGRALVLDPDNAEAATILGHLLLKTPDTIPVEARAAADLDRGRSRQNVTRQAAYGFLGMLPGLGVLALLPVRHAWPVVLTAILLAATGCVALWIARRPYPMRSPSFLVLLACNSALIGMAGLLFGPLLILPMFLVGSMAGWLPQPTTYPSWLILVAHGLPLVVLLALERIGVLPSSFGFEHGSLVMSSYAVELTSTSTSVLFALSFVAQAVHLSIVSLTHRRVTEAAQDQQHAQSWHLKQLLPKAPR